MPIWASRVLGAATILALFGNEEAHGLAGVVGPRERFSAMESSGQKASSWWTMPMPAEAASAGSTLMRTSGAVDEDVVAGESGRWMPDEDFAEGGFAGAVFAHEGVAFALVDGEGDVVEGGDAAEGFGDVLELDEGGGHFFTRAR